VVRHGILSCKTWVRIPCCLVQPARALLRWAKPWLNWAGHDRRLLPGAADRGGYGRPRPGHSRLGLWRGRYVAWEVRGVGGCGQPGLWRGWPWLGRCVARPVRAPDRGRSWPVAKPSTKVLNAKENTNLYVV
jgi:hypothetical protein